MFYLMYIITFTVSSTCFCLYFLYSWCHLSMYVICIPSYIQFLIISCHICVYKSIDISIYLYLSIYISIYVYIYIYIYIYICAYLFMYNWSIINFSLFGSWMPKTCNRTSVPKCTSCHKGNDRAGEHVLMR